MEFYIPRFFSQDLKTNTNNFDHMTFARDYDSSEIYKNNIKKYENDLKTYVIDNILNNCQQLIEKFNNEAFISHNIYQYQKPKNIKQYVIWTFNDKQNSDTILNLIKSYIDGKEYILWTNDKTKFSSIATVKHYHLMIREIQPKMNLKKIVMVTRHGPRFPITKLPKLDSFESGNEALLTSNGEKYCEDFGKNIKRIYENIFNFDIKNAEFYSSNTDRTIKTCYNFMKGLFNSTKQNIIINNILLGDFITLFDDYNKKMKFSDLGLNIKDSEIKLFNKKIYDLFGFKVKYIDEYFNVYSTLRCYISENKSIPCEWTNNDMDLLRKIVVNYHFILSKSNVDTFIDPILIYIFNLLKFNNKNFIFLSTHDTVIYPLAYKIYKKRINMPDFCTCLRFELWDQALMIYYDDLLIYEKYF